MTAKNRAALIGKLHTVLKKHFKPAPPSPGRPLMEHVLYASLLEDSPADLADEGFAKCEQEYFDWNEVRVTTVTELAEVLNRLPNPQAAAMRLKRNLQSIFETFYNFDIDFMKKENLGKAVAKFESMAGMSPFVLSYIVQHGLGGHAIPIDKSSMKLMWLCGIVSDAEAESGKVPGIERTIPKNKSIEFSSLIHQAAIAFQANNKDKAVWEVLLAVNKDAKALFDRPAAEKPKSEKRSAAKAKAAEAAAEASANKATAKPEGKSKPGSGKAAAAEVPTKSLAKPTAAKAVSEKAAKPVSEKSAPDKATSKSSADKATSAKSPTAAKAVSAKPTSEKKPAAPLAKPSSAKSMPAAPKAVKPSEPTAKSSTNKPEAKKPAADPKSVKKKTEAEAPLKKVSVKKPVVKQEASEKKSEKKSAPPTKKGAPVEKAASVEKGASVEKAAPVEKAATGSTNKKLTKQKPR